MNSSEKSRPCKRNMPVPVGLEWGFCLVCACFLASWCFRFCYDRLVSDFRRCRVRRHVHWGSWSFLPYWANQFRPSRKQGPHFEGSCHNPRSGIFRGFAAHALVNLNFHPPTMGGRFFLLALSATAHFDVTPCKEAKEQWSINHINSTGITYCKIEWPPEHFSSNKAGIRPRTWRFQSFGLEPLSDLNFTFVMTDRKIPPLTSKMPGLPLFNQYLLWVSWDWLLHFDSL